MLISFVAYGKSVKAVTYPHFSDELVQTDGRQTVAYEARQLKCLLLKLHNN